MKKLSNLDFVGSFFCVNDQKSEKKEDCHQQNKSEKCL